MPDVDFLSLEGDTDKIVMYYNFLLHMLENTKFVPEDTESWLDRINLYICKTKFLLFRERDEKLLDFEVPADQLEEFNQFISVLEQVDIPSFFLAKIKKNLPPDYKRKEEVVNKVK